MEKKKNVKQKDAPKKNAPKKYEKPFLVRFDVPSAAGQCVNGSVPAATIISRKKA